MKTDTVLALICALENASEMIRGHGEEGGQFQEDYPDFSLDTYFKQTKKVADKLDKEVERLKTKYSL